MSAWGVGLNFIAAVDVLQTHTNLTTI
jgi:hypothetical protein